MPRDMLDQMVGDVWTWTAIDADTKLMINWTVGLRDAETALEFMEFIADIYEVDRTRARRLTGELFEQFALRPYAAEHIEHLHAWLEAEELQQLRRLPRLIQLHVVGGAMRGVGNRGRNR